MRLLLDSSSCEGRYRLRFEVESLTVGATEPTRQELSPLPLHVTATADMVTLAGTGIVVGLLDVRRFELEVKPKPDVTDPLAYQNCRGQLRSLALRLNAQHVATRLEQATRSLVSMGISNAALRFEDGFLAGRIQASSGLSVCDISFRLHLLASGSVVRVIADHISVYGYFPTPGPVMIHRLLHALFTQSDRSDERRPLHPSVRGLCDLEIDVVRDVLWHLLPPHGWRLPAANGVELTTLAVERSGIEIGYEPVGARGASDLGIRPAAVASGASHDLMHSADELLRMGDLEGALGGYRALLISAGAGSDQARIIERILAITTTRSAWFADATEVARQAVSRAPQFAPSHLALAAIANATGDARSAAREYARFAELAALDGNEDGAALGALAGARLLRMLDPRTATQLYQLALEYDPGSIEAAEGVAERLADEGRWPELIKLWRARAVATPEPHEAAALRLRLADVLITHVGDLDGAERELATALSLAPNDSAGHEMQAKVLAARGDTASAIAAWQRAIAVAEALGDRKALARAWTHVAEISDATASEAAWHRALEFDPLSHVAMAGLARAASARGDFQSAAQRFERVRGLGLPFLIAARYELELGRAYQATGRHVEARTALRRIAIGKNEIAAQAHALLAEMSAHPDTGPSDDGGAQAAREYEAAIEILCELADNTAQSTTSGHSAESDRLRIRAAEISVARAELLERGGHIDEAVVDWQRAQQLAHRRAPSIERQAARALLARTETTDNADQRLLRITALLATEPSEAERAELLLARMVIWQQATPANTAAALLDAQTAVALVSQSAPRIDLLTVIADMQTTLGDFSSAAATLAQRAAERADVGFATAVQISDARDVAQAWADAGNPEKSLASARAGVALAEREPAAAAPHVAQHLYQLMGDAAFRVRQWRDVQTTYSMLLAMAPENLSDRILYSHRVAVAAEKNGDAAIALATIWPLMPLLSVNGGTADAVSGINDQLRIAMLRQYADLSEKSGDAINAAQALDALATVPPLSPAQRADAAYRAGEIYRRNDYLDEAQRALEVALRLAETHMPALDALELICKQRNDDERLTTILGRKVAATAKFPLRQKPLLTRLAELQLQLGRPDVADQTFRRALELDASWRPALRYIADQLIAAAQPTAIRALVQLSGELESDGQRDTVTVEQEKRAARRQLAEMLLQLSADSASEFRDVVPLLTTANRAEPDAVFEKALAILGETVLARADVVPLTNDHGDHAALVQFGDESTRNRRGNSQNAEAYRQAAIVARSQSRFRDALAALETACHLEPNNADVIREIIELGMMVDDHEAAARHLQKLVQAVPPAERGDVFLELSELCFEHMDDPRRGREALRQAADAFAPGARRDAALRLLASEAGAGAAWQICVDALTEIPPSSRSGSDLEHLAQAHQKLGHEAAAVRVLGGDKPAATLGGRGAALLAAAVEQRHRKCELARTLELLAQDSSAGDAQTYLSEALILFRDGVEDEGAVARIEIALAARNVLPATDQVASTGAVGNTLLQGPLSAAIEDLSDDHLVQALARLPDSPVAKQRLLERFVVSPQPRAKARALFEMSRLARKHEHDLLRAFELLTIAHRVDPSLPAIWLPLADALIASDDVASARALYEKIQAQPDLDHRTRAVATERLGLLEQVTHNALPDVSKSILQQMQDYSSPGLPIVAMPADAVVAVPAVAVANHDETLPYEIPIAFDAPPVAIPTPTPTPIPALAPLLPGPARAKAMPLAVTLAAPLTATTTTPARGVKVLVEGNASESADLQRAREFAAREQWVDAIVFAERAANPPTIEHAALPLLEQLYRRTGDFTAASFALGRQIASTAEPTQRSPLWLRRADLYQELNREAEVFRCLKEAHACDPQNLVTARRLREYAAARGNWSFVASLLYREIAGTEAPAARAALHRLLAQVFREHLSDAISAQRNEGQAQALDGNAMSPSTVAAASEFEHALLSAEQSQDRGAQIDAAEMLWRQQPGNAAAFRVLASDRRDRADLEGLFVLTKKRADQCEDMQERTMIWLDAAHCAESHNGLDDAARAYDQALIASPDHVFALDARASLAFRVGDYATADFIYRDLDHDQSMLPPEELAWRRSVIAENLGSDSTGPGSEALKFAITAATAAPNRRDLWMRVQELATRAGDYPTALAAARSVLALVPLDDTNAPFAIATTMVELHRAMGDRDAAIAQLERALRDQPHHVPAIEALVELHREIENWPAAARYQYQLVPLSESHTARAERLYALGVLLSDNLDDPDRADDVFLRAIDLIPNHVPTLRRLLDTFWRNAELREFSDVALELAQQHALFGSKSVIDCHAAGRIVAALCADPAHHHLVESLFGEFGDGLSLCIAAALGELADATKVTELTAAVGGLAVIARANKADLASIAANSNNPAVHDAIAKVWRDDAPPAGT